MMLLEVFKEKFDKRLFNPKNKEDIKVYKEFLVTGRWGQYGCPFILEWPYLTTPDMIKDKIIQEYLNIK